MAGRSIGQPLTRREFNAASVNALFVGMTVWMSGCGGGSGGSNAYPTSPTSTSASAPAASGGDKSGSIADNHGHVATVTSAVLQAGGAVTLSIRGTADHDHALQLTQDQVRLVAAGTRVSTTSGEGGAASDGYGGTMGGHAHSVTFN